MLKVKYGQRPSRPPPLSSSWVEWGLTESIWELMSDCWRGDPALRPSIDGVISQYPIEGTIDDRPRSESISPSCFRMAASGQCWQYPAISDLDAILSPPGKESLPQQCRPGPYV